jgi:outer membrane biosynthesis protein TonB
MGSVTSEQGAETHALIKSQPMALEVPVVATGARPGDQSQKRELFTETTETVLVFENGVVIRLSAAVTAGQLLFLTNKNSGKEIVTQVLRKRSFKPTACYVELEFTEAAPGFWGVEFPPADSGAQAELPAGSVAAELAEAELTEEEPGVHAPPPDAAEVAKLRQEVEALKAQLKSLATTPATEVAKPEETRPEYTKPEISEKVEEGKPAEVKLDVMRRDEVKPEVVNQSVATPAAAAKIELMSPHEPKPEPAKPEGVNPEAAKPEEANALPGPQPEQGSSYPIRMQLPKSEGTLNRTTEFAADDKALDHLLPKPSLDFAKYPGSAEPSPKLYSRSARRGLAGPIGVMVLIVLLLVAVGIMTYRLGWLSKGPKNEASAAMFPVNADNTNGEAEARQHAESAKADEPPIEKSVTASTGTPEVSSTEPGAENARPAEATRKPAERAPEERKSVKRTPTVREKVRDTAPTNTGDDIVIPPKLLKAIRSLSPPEALRAYASGVVVLDTLVDENGRVASATPISGPKALYQKAADTVKEYVYQPGTRNGKQVPAHVEVKIQFWYEP